MASDFLSHPKYIQHPGRRLAYQTLVDEGGSLLDAGCCMGRDYLFFINHGLKYTGIDITPKFIAAFKERYPNANVRVASVLNIPFEDKAFTSVYSGSVVQHMYPADIPLAIKEMWRVVTNLMILMIPPFVEKESFPRYDNKIFTNRFNKKRFLKNITNLEVVGSIELKENIKGFNQSSQTLVIIRKEGI